MNPSETAKAIASLHLRAPPVSTQLQVRQTSDVQTFLAERRSQNILSAIEKGLQRTSDSFTAELAKYRNTSWEALKQRTLERHRGIVSGESMRDSTMRDVTSVGNFGKSSVFGSTMDTSVRHPDSEDPRLTLDLTSVHSLQRIEALTSVIKDLNDARSQTARRTNLIPALSEAILRFGADSRSVQLADALKVISAQITDEEDEPLEAINYRSFKKDYIERKGLDKMSERITEGSRRFLEGLAWGVVISEISQHPQVQLSQSPF